VLPAKEVLVLAELLAMDVEWGVPIIALLVLVLFGGARLPKLARSLGSAGREYRKGLAGEDEDEPGSDSSEND
jgi:TatA/E family protein of Tat protein translocase